MSIEDTIRMSSDEVMALTAEQIQKLPTMLDVLEYLSVIENQNVQSMLGNTIPWLDLYKDGYYNWVSDKPWTNEAKLMPLSKTPFLLMRGQNDYFPTCVPSLYRKQKNMTDDAFVTLSRIRSAEFMLAYDKHPVIQELRQNCQVEDMAIAQHYGFATEYLDITNNKWVAAFFATTRFEENTYLPVENGFGRGYGVLYLMKNGVGPLDKELQNRLRILGFQYFQRPSRQNTMAYRMERGENFDNSPVFCRIVFRHNTEASKLVYEYSFRQNRYFPKDTLSEIAREIRKPDYKISMGAIEKSRELGVTFSDEEIQALLSNYHIGINEYDHPIAGFSMEVIAKEWDEWHNFGREYLQRHTLPVMPMYKLEG